MDAHAFSCRLDRRWWLLLTKAFKHRRSLEGFSKDVVVCQHHPPFKCPRNIEVADTAPTPPALVDPPSEYDIEPWDLHGTIPAERKHKTSERRKFGAALSRGGASRLVYNTRVWLNSE